MTRYASQAFHDDEKVFTIQPCMACQSLPEFLKLSPTLIVNASILFARIYISCLG